MDGVVIEGESLVDTAALTGESVPRKAAAGDEVISGCVNGSGTLKVEVTKEFRRLRCCKDSGTGGKCQQQEGKCRKFHYQICKILYPCGNDRCCDSCSTSSADLRRRLG